MNIYIVVESEKVVSTDENSFFGFKFIHMIIVAVILFYHRLLVLNSMYTVLKKWDVILCIKA